MIVQGSAKVPLSHGGWIIYREEGAGRGRRAILVIDGVDGTVVMETKNTMVAMGLKEGRG